MLPSTPHQRTRITALLLLLTGGQGLSAAAWAADDASTPAPAKTAPAPALAGDAVEAPAAAPPPGLQVQFGVRVGTRAQNLQKPDRLGQLWFDTVYVEPRFGGRPLPALAWQANFNVGVPGFVGFDQNPLGIMDLIVKIEPHPLFNVWAGRFPVPADRSNLAGPYYMSPWNYPGLYPTGFVGPKTGATGRDNGATLWGQIAEGKIKYYLGAFELVTPQAKLPGHHPMYAGRIALCLLGAEPGFYDAGTYYGTKDIVALGFAMQLQGNGAGTLEAPQDLRIVMADFLAEKNVAGAGTFTLEGTYYDFHPAAPVGRAFYLLASYLTPGTIGIGKLQPLVRWQQTLEPEWSLLDAFITYVIRGYDLRVAFGYQRADLGPGPVGNALQLAIQVQQ